MNGDLGNYTGHFCQIQPTYLQYKILPNDFGNHSIRLITQSNRTTYEVDPKNPAYLFGKHVVRPAIDIVWNLGTRVVKGGCSLCYSIDSMLSQFITFPGAYAQSDKSCSTSGTVTVLNKDPITPLHKHPNKISTEVDSQIKETTYCHSTKIEDPSSLRNKIIERIYEKMSCSDQISKKAIHIWLRQFDIQDQDRALTLLSKIDYFNYNRVINDLKSLHIKLIKELHQQGFIYNCNEEDKECKEKKIDKCTGKYSEATNIDFSRVYVAKSGDLISYFYRNANAIPAICFKNLSELPEDPSNRALVILEDYTGTGSQFIYSSYAKTHYELFNKYKKVYLVSLVINDQALEIFDLLKSSNLSLLTERLMFTLGIDQNDEMKKKVVYQNLAKIDVTKVEALSLHQEISITKMDGAEDVSTLVEKYTAKYRGGHFTVGHTVFFYNCPNNVPEIFWANRMARTDHSNWYALFRRVEDISVYPVVANRTPIEEHSTASNVVLSATFIISAQESDAREAANVADHDEGIALAISEERSAIDALRSPPIPDEIMKVAVLSNCQEEIIFSGSPLQTSRSDKQDSYVILGFEDEVLPQRITALLGKELITIKSDHFSDTSSYIKIKVGDKHGLKNKSVHLISGNSQKGDKSINQASMEIFLAIDAAKQAGAKEINLYLPYLAYARQDKVSQQGEPMAAQAILRIFTSLGATRVTVLDIHNDAVFGTLGLTAVGTNKFAMKEFANRFKQKKESGVKLDELIIVAPDKGAIQRAKLFLQAMEVAGFSNIAFAYFDKSRNYAVKGQVQSMDLREVVLSTGEVLTNERAEIAFKGKTAILIDDIADTCNTMLHAISDNIVGRYRAKEAYAAITHGVLTGDALEKIAKTKELTGMLITDSIPLRGEVPSKLEVVSSAPVFAEAIRFSTDS